MGGRILDYEAKRIYNVGKSEGRSEGAANTYISLIKDGIITITDAAKRLNVPEEWVRRRM